MTTFAEFKTQVINALASEVGDLSDQLLYEAACGALNAILPWCAKRASSTIISDGVAVSYDLPAISFKAEAIRDVSTGLFVERFTLSPQAKRIGSQLSFEWMEWPTGKLFLSSKLPAGRTLEIFYSTYWSHPDSSASDEYEFETPQVVMPGLVFWAASYCLIPESISASRTRQYNLKVDSGVPTDNPVEASARFLRQLFMDEMNRLPKQPGGAP